MNVRWFGGDLSYPLTPTIRFVGTLNPDFSNVEIDQQTIAPQEFQRQLVEYRPFFAQGAAYINANSSVRAPAGTNTQPPFLVFYSPSVGPFDSGGKVEGTFDDNAFGALTFHGYDDTTNNTFSDRPTVSNMPFRAARSPTGATASSPITASPAGITRSRMASKCATSRTA